MALSNSFWGTSDQPTQAAPTPQPAPKKGGVAGLLGGVYDMLVKPVVNSVGGGISDIPKIGSSIGYLGKVAVHEATGNKEAAQADTDRQAKLLETTNFRKNYEDQNLEKAAGKSASQILNITAPVAGAGSFVGKSGLRLVGNGIGTGAKYGALGGAANAMSEGGSGKDVFVGAGEGAATGAALGGVGGTVGAVAGSTLAKNAAKGTGRVASGVLEGLTGKSRAAAADVAGAGSEAASGNQAGGFMNKAATKAGARSGQNIMADQAKTDFGGVTPTDLKGATSYDKSGDPVGLAQVSSFLRSLKMPAHAQNMEASHNFLTGVLGGNLQDATDGIVVNASGARQIGANSVLSNLGKTSKNAQTGSSADTALRTIRQATENLTPTSTVQDVLGSVAKLEQARERIGKAVSSGDAQAAKEDEVYKSVLDHLHEKLNGSDVNKAVQNFKVGPDLAKTIQEDAVDNGVSPEMAQHAIDTINNSSTYDAMRSAMQPAVVAGKLSRVAKDTFASSVPKEATGKGGGAGVPSWELAMSMHNPAYLTAAAGRLAQNAGIADRALGKINPGAFKAGQEEALTPDAITARKLQTPGGGPATGDVPQPTEAANPMAQNAQPVPTGSAPGGNGGPISNAIGAATGAIKNAAGANSLIGALTGQAANQAGQGNAQMGGGEAAAPEIPPVDQTADMGGDMGGMADQGGFDPSTVPGGTLEDLEQEISNDPKNASIYKSIYDEAQKKATAGKPSAAQQKNQLAIKNAQSTLSQIKDNFSKAGGGQGNIGGTLATLAGKLNLNSGAGSYNDQATALAAGLYKALGNTGTISDKDQQLIAKLIPKLTDSPEKANSKIASLENLLQMAQENSSVGPDSTGSASSQLNQLTGGQ